MFLSMLDTQKASPVDISSLRTGIMAGSICPEQVMRRVNKELNMPDVTICYGTNVYSVLYRITKLRNDRDIPRITPNAPLGQFFE